jgi:hypothetical protein
MIYWDIMLLVIRLKKEENVNIKNVHRDVENTKI